MMSGIVTLVLLVLFIVGSIWVWSPHCSAQFDAAARLPLEDADEEQTP